MEQLEAKEIAKQLNDLTNEKREEVIYQILISGIFSSGVINDITEFLEYKLYN
tara:strand:- start:962 stop:1120 length:159 start_codon:yes stop_codon:yes gene_type:complete